MKQRLANGDRHSLRIATTDTTIAFHDEVFGNQRYNLVQDIGDTIVRRSDGIYSYQLAVTVDDLDMGITDIVRGRDLLRSSALQIYIRKALISAGFQPSEPAEATISYAHLPLSTTRPGNVSPNANARSTSVFSRRTASPRNRSSAIAHGYSACKETANTLNHSP